MKRLFFLLGCWPWAAAATCDAHLQRTRLAEVFVADERFDRWLGQFAERDRPLALNLVRDLELFGYVDTLNALKSLRTRLHVRLREDGFDEDHVDYTKPFTARSGDLISFLYRRVNQLPSARIIPSELLGERGGDDRALVILDDYVGTGAQILVEYYGKMYAEQFNRYRKIYVAVIAANSSAIASFREVKLGRQTEVAARMSRAFRLAPDDDARFRAGMIPVDPAKVELLYVHEDEPLHARVDAATRDFLLRHREFENSPSAPWGVAGTASRVAFFYGPPNGTPDVLWNSLGRIDGRPLLPLFQKTEDVSHYDFAAGLPARDVVWGGR